MTRRVNTGHAAVVPWQVPDLDAIADNNAFREIEFVDADLAPPNGRELATITGDQGESQPPPLASPAISESAEEAKGRGYAEGFAVGRRDGYGEGYAEGQRQAEEHLAGELRLLDAITRQFAEPDRALERPVEEAIVALAMEVARWVIGTEVSRSPDYLIGLIREAVAQVPIDVGTPAIVLNPIDVELVRGLAPDLENNGISLIADESVEPGGCLVVADGAEGIAMKDRRWHPRAHQGVCEVDLTLASRWRNAMLAMFEGEEA
jgi:flagellar assembly protein FliH